MRRSLSQVIESVPSEDGDGVAIRRIAGRAYQTLLDPFLLVDEIISESPDEVGGFPPHPHRGFETVTLMLKGGFEHRDHLGNVGSVNAGGAQWMTAGKGIIHSEMPLAEAGKIHGYQIWLNLPASEKWSEPRWRDIQAEEVLEQRFANAAVIRLFSGSLSCQVGGIDYALVGPMATVTEAVIAHLYLPPQSQFHLALAEQNLFAALVIEGELPPLRRHQLGIWSGGDSVVLRSGESAAQLLLLSGRPLREPIVQYGPFVMNSREQIEQAIKDYQSGQFGE